MRPPLLLLALSGVALSAALDLRGLPPLKSANILSEKDRLITHLPTSSCIHTTASPIAVGDQIIFATHKKTPRGQSNSECRSDPTPTALYAVSAASGEARVLVANADAEASPVYADGAVLTPLVHGGGGIATWFEGSGAITQPIRMGMDSAPLWDPAASQLVVGTINSPMPLCQKGPNPNCGVMMALGRDGKIKHLLGREQGFRGWVTAGPTTDGAHYYIGTGSGMDGAVERADAHACAVVKLNKDLQVVASYDDGDPGCRDIGKLKSAAIGEIPVVNDTLYVQYLGSTDGREVLPFVLLDASTLRPRCRAEIPAPANRSLAGFYQAPVVDEEGRAYFISNTAKGMELIRVDRDCSYESLVDARGGSFSSPALADDRYVLVAEPGALLVVDRERGRADRHPLPTAAEVVGAPLITQHGVTVVASDGAVTTLKDTGISGYGSAPWPRFRKDNLASAGAK